MSRLKDRPQPVKPERWRIQTGTDWIIHDRIQSAVWDFDKAITEVERTWGVDRLPYIVSDATRQRWWRAMDAFSQAIFDGDWERTRTMADNLVKGIARLVEEAQALGATPLDPKVIEARMPSGRVLRIVQAWPKNAARVESEPDVLTWTVDEVARLVESQRMANEVKEIWPGAEVTRVRSKIGEEINDDIPF